MLAASLLASFLAVRPAAAAPEQAGSLEPVLSVAVAIPALRAEVATQAEVLLHTPPPVIESDFLLPAAAAEAGGDMKDEARRVVAGLVARPDALGEDLDAVAGVFGRSTAQGLHAAADFLRDQGLDATLERVRRTVAVDDPFYAQRLRDRLNRMFDAGIADSARGEAVKDAREQFRWQAGLRRGEQKAPAKILPFKRPEGK